MAALPIFGTPLGGSVSCRHLSMSNRPKWPHSIGRLPLGVGLVLAASVLGCSTFLEEVDAFQRGWRTAVVLEVGPAAQLRRAAMTDCRKVASAEQLEQRRFAVVIDRTASRRHSHVVLLEEGSSVNPGDVIRTNILRCGTPVEVQNAHDRTAASP
ncbi:hypothetical protein [Variovorax sp. RA8]|uniref:hypothetical protein n=1 Tax=Variovorax sp. (strain JCM 16519 / RA8) TaxID=662548 RepID=UPI0013A5A603|nr:hypothetical protein [Variovorax sp. RA8]